MTCAHLLVWSPRNGEPTTIRECGAQSPCPNHEQGSDYSSVSQRDLTDLRAEIADLRAQLEAARLDNVALLSRGNNFADKLRLSESWAEEQRKRAEAERQRREEAETMRDSGECKWEACGRCRACLTDAKETAEAHAEAAERRAEELRQTLEEVQHHAENARKDWAAERQKREEAEGWLATLFALLSAAEKAKEAAMAVAAAAERDAREFRLIAENARDGAKMRADQLAAAEKLAEVYRADWNKEAQRAGAAEKRATEAAIEAARLKRLWDAEYAECDSLRSRCEELTKALEPFAKIGGHLRRAGMRAVQELHAWHMVPGESVALGTGDCFAAERALGSSRLPEKP